jgi:hypothetical protein
MEKIKFAFKWMLRDFFTASVLIFAAVYFVWTWLAPYDNFSRQIFWILLLYVASAGLYAISKPRVWLKIIFRIPTVFFWLVNIWFIINFFPSFRDIAIHDGTIYILARAEHRFIPELDPVYDESLYLTKWKWGVIPERHELEPWKNERFNYDKQMKIMGIVQQGRLIYLDSNPPLKFRTGEQYGDHLYYPFSECINWAQPYISTCNVSRHTIYQCDLDNTSCMPLPMQYIGIEYYGELKVNEATGDLDYKVQHHPGTEPMVNILVYSYSNHPRCYVEGCEILPSP